MKWGSHHEPISISWNVTGGLCLSSCYYRAPVSLESWTGTCDPKTGTCSEAVSLACFNLQGLNLRWSKWCFQRCFIFTPTWGNDPIWLIFFKWVETTNYCWWLKSCTTWDVWNPINNGKNYQPQLVSRILSINSDDFVVCPASHLIQTLAPGSRSCNDQDVTTYNDTSNRHVFEVLHVVHVRETTAQGAFFLFLVFFLWKFQGALKAFAWACWIVVICQQPSCLRMLCKSLISELKSRYQTMGAGECLEPSMSHQYWLYILYRRIYICIKFIYYIYVLL